jgi:hypothetical protein
VIEELHNLYSSPIRMIKSNGMRWAGHVARMGRKHRNAYKVLVGDSEGKSPLGRQEVGGWIILKWILDRKGGMDWIDVAQDRDQWKALVNTAMNLLVP